MSCYTKYSMKKINYINLLALLISSALVLSIVMTATIPGFTVLAKSADGKDALELDFAPLAQRTYIYDVNGNEIGRLGLENRELVKLKEVPESVKNALLATEDRTFWTNPGFDAVAVFRAFNKNITSGGITEGASTITQQLIKNRILTSEQTFARKFKELVLSMRLTKKYSKSEILEEYLNTIYFGQGAYGVKSAAELWFKKQLKDLSIADAALLAGSISDPNRLNPFLYPERAQARRAEVIDAMVDAEYINSDEAEQAKISPLPTEKPISELRPNSFWTEEVQTRLLADKRLGATPQERYNKLLRGGLKIYTTLDPKAQESAESAVEKVLPKKNNWSASIVIMERGTGKVVGMVAGSKFDPSESVFNLATQGKRQPGSTFKAVTLATAFENGYSPNDTIDGGSPCSIKGYGPDWKVSNTGGGGGVMNLFGAARGSVNCAFAHLIASLGPEKVSEMGTRLGVKDELPPYLSLTLGAIETSPLQMTTVFNTLASDGVLHEPSFVSKVTNAEGKVVFEEDYKGTKAVEPQVARTVAEVLKGVVSGGTGTSAAISGHVVAGKTGTTEFGADAWFCGITMYYSACVWMGNPDSRAPMYGVFGGTYSAPMFRESLKPLLADKARLDFPSPDRGKWPKSKFISDKGRGKGKPTSTTTESETPVTTSPPSPVSSTLPPEPTTTIPEETTTTSTTMPMP
jgi:membrane peptidoglycan carboxypeptidase